MKYFAAISNAIEYRAALKAGHHHALASYARRARLNIPKMLEQYASAPDAHFILDSGAWSAFNSGHHVDLGHFADFAARLASQYRGQFPLEVINLDVIGDHAASQANFRALTQRGLDPVPVFTRNAPLADLTEMSRDFPRLALGGLVPVAHKRAELEPWLDRCFEAAATPSRLHLLGVAKPWIVERYPLASCDSSAFTQVVRFKEARASVPLEGEGPAAMKCRVMAAEIARLARTLAV